MKILRGTGTTLGSPSVVTVGKFTLLHRGHRVLLDRVRARAAETGALSAVVTFDRHPMETIAPDRAPGCVLATLDQRLGAFEAAGVAAVCVLEFTSRMAAMEAPDFVRSVLIDTLGARAVVVGEDFRFGHGRRGTPALIRDLGLDVETIPLVREGDDEVSSSAIRELVAAGDVRAAAQLAGRGYRLAGEVVRGAGRGKDLGFPTANLQIDARACLPAFGIYAGWWLWHGRQLPAAISVGMTPQFDDVLAPKVEAFVLGLDEQLYGDHAELEFVARLRDEQRFDSIDALTEQIGRDVEMVEQLLAG